MSYEAGVFIGVISTIIVGGSLWWGIAAACWRDDRFNSLEIAVRKLEAEFGTHKIWGHEATGTRIDKLARRLYKLTRKFKKERK